MACLSYLIVRIRQRETVDRAARLAFTLLAVVSAVTLLSMFRWVYNVRYDADPEIWQSVHREWVGGLFHQLTDGLRIATGFRGRILVGIEDPKRFDPELRPLLRPAPVAAR